MFIRFANQSEYLSAASSTQVDKVYNSLTDSPTSLKKYLQTISYNSLTVDGLFFPSSSVSAQVSHNEGYYRPYSVSNIEGYTSDTEMGTREMQLVKEVMDQVGAQVYATCGASADVHGDSAGGADGYLDAVTFVCLPSDTSTVGWSDLLWPHQWYYQPNYGGGSLGGASAGSLQLGSYSMIWATSILDTANYSSSIISHEFLHIMGMPDLYRYYASGMPVAKYDIMGVTQSRQQQALLQYNIRNYLGFGSNLNQITSSTKDITLSVAQYQTDAEQTALIVKNPLKADEYFVIEMRRNTGIDANIGDCDGLLVYRVNENVATGAMYGPPDSIYVFRDQETGLNAGNGLYLVADLQPGSSTHRSSIGKIGTLSGFDNSALTYNDGTNSNIVIDNLRLSVDGNSMTFDVKINSTGISDGWVSENGNKYYYQDGIALTGLQVIDGATYYFNSQGQQVTGGFVYNGNNYYAVAGEDNGALKHDYFRELGNGERVYYGEDCTQPEGWITRTENGETVKYYQNNVRRIVAGIQNIGNKLYYFNSLGQLQDQTGWYGNYYLVSGEILTGIQTIDGKKYCLGDDGVKKTGGFVYNGNNYYAVAGEDNGALKHDYFRELGNGERVYYGEDCTQPEGWITLTENGETVKYYQNNVRRIVMGVQNIESKLYYFDNYGRLVSDGWVEIEGLRYYISNGIALTGLQVIDGATYYFNSQGQQVTGGFVYNGNNYYAVAGEDNGALKHDYFRELGNGERVYYAEDCTQPEGWITRTENGETVKYYQNNVRRIVAGIQNIGNKLYYFNSLGQLQDQTGWYGNYYLVSGEILTGIQTIDGKKYCLGDDGVKKTGGFVYNGNNYYAVAGEDNGALKHDYFRELGNGERVYYGEDCTQPEGWITLTENGETVKYYQNNVRRIVMGVQNIESKLYYFDNYGRLVSDGWVEIEGLRYYISNGIALTGLQVIDGATYYFNSQGQQVTGGFVYNGNNYYAVAGEDNGALKHDYFRELGNGERVYYAEDCTQPEGWITRTENDVAVKYYQNNVRRIVTGIQSIGNKLYYFNSLGQLQDQTGWYGNYYLVSGEILTGIQTIDGEKYCLGDDGVKKTGGFVYNGNNYYAVAGEGNGALKHDYFRELGNGERVYYGEDCTQPEGWITRTENGETVKYYQNNVRRIVMGVQNIESKLYYFDNYGRLVSDGWVEIEGLRYYISNGIALTGLQVIDGATYYFNSQGQQVTGGFVYNGNNYYAVAGEDNGALKHDYFRELGNGERVYYAEDCTQPEGWITRTENGETVKYYQNNVRRIVTGIQNIEGKPYYFNSLGQLQDQTGWYGNYYLVSGEILTGIQTIDGKKYCLGDDGVKKTGGFVYNGNNYYAVAGEDNGALKHDYFRELGNGERVYYGEDCTQPEGWITRTENGETVKYYQNNVRRIVAGIQNIGNKLYYFNSLGQLQDQTGWYGNYYLVSGEILTGIQTIDGKKYCLGDDGVKKTGGFVYNGNNYYAVAGEDNGALKHDYFRELGNGERVYYGEDCTQPEGWITRIENGVTVKYYQNNVRRIVTGFASVDGYIYYFDSLGVWFKVSEAGFYTINELKCYFDSQSRYVAPPVIGSITYDVSGNTATVRILATSSTLTSIVAYSWDGGNTWIPYNQKEYSVGTTISAGQLQVKDAVGNITKYGSDITLKSKGPYLGIDVSSYQGIIDWAKVKASGVSFAMIRALTWSNSVGGYAIDPYFEYNVRNAKANGIKVGVYLYSYAFSLAEMATEVNFFHNSAQMQSLRAAGIAFDYPVFIDYEWGTILDHTDYTTRTQIVRTGMVMLDHLGYRPGFYTYHNWALNQFDAKSLYNEGYDFWYARYLPTPDIYAGTSSSLGYSAQMWQYSSSGSISGIEGNVDLNICYVDYDTLINGGTYTGGTVTPTLSVYDQGTNQVVSGQIVDILAQIVQNEVGGASSPEVYKAQAIAAYSWILYEQEHGNAIPSVKLATATAAVKSAVAEVSGKRLMYNGATAYAPYGSASAAYTNSASNMLGLSLPYLTNVTSPESQYRNQTRAISFSTMTNNVTKIVSSSVANATPHSQWLTDATYDSYGYLISIKVCGTTVTASKFYADFYMVLSPHCQITYNASSDTWTSVTDGYGHCVGMSQWGAITYAANGWNYSQILAHYYPGTTLV